MSPSAFLERVHPPEAEALAAALGGSRSLWDQLRHRIALRHHPVDEEWVFSGAKYGWSLRLKRKKRAIVYLIPCKGHFRVGMALGEKAVRAARENDLPPSVLEIIEASPRYAEGRGVRIEVTTKSDLKTVEVLAAIKMAQ